uniref:Uncharacterized protein n=1 Tax=Aquila chrysaetos chrysaetos TaxID=223781 RepID=A0A663DYI7_AQUCH
SLLLHSKRSRAAELGQRRGRGLVEQQGHGLRLLGLGDQHGVAAQHHRLVLQLVAVDPGEDARQARVGHAVGDPVQQVEVAGPAQPLVLGVGHADALRADGQGRLTASMVSRGRWWVWICNTLHFLSLAALAQHFCSVRKAVAGPEK